MALCSLSIGCRFTPFSFTSSIIILPPATSVSLFASATSFPCPMNSTVGTRPDIPTVAFTTVSTSEWRQTFIAFSGPQRTSVWSP